MRDVRVRATARSKKDAKQEAARLALSALAQRGIISEHVSATVASAGTGTGTARAVSPEVGSRMYVVLLKELCDEYKLPAAEWKLISDTGPAHLRRFEVAVGVGSHWRSAASTTKKSARQLAAQALYMYLRENLARITADFCEVSVDRRRASVTVLKLEATGWLIQLCLLA